LLNASNRLQHTLLVGFPRSNGKSTYQPTPGTSFKVDKIH
jgi:hypothetical protein